VRKRAILAVAALVTVSLVAGSTPAFAADDYPTWADVEAAKHDEKAKKAEIAKIEDFISGLEAKNSGLAKDALVVNEEYNEAKGALDDATEASDILNKKADAAAKAAATSREQVGRLAAQLSRTGGSDVTLTLLVDSGNAADYLYALGQLDGVTAHTAAIYAQAITARNESESLQKQAKAAAKVRATRAAAAKSDLAEAQAAAATAKTNLTAQQAKAKQLYDQLASLKGTTSKTEKAYEAGVAWEKAQAAVKKPPAPPPGPVVNPPPPAPSGSGVSGAIAFAEAQLGDAYQLGGSGPDVWDCSGLTKAAYASVGVYIGTHSATNQYATMASEGRLLPLADLQAGDLLFYSSGGSTTGTKYHTALYIGAGKMIEAPYPGSVVRIAAIRYGDLVPYAGRPTP
jgi:peptidoglycan DL-endopeptidase CwlO